MPLPVDGEITPAVTHFGAHVQFRVQFAGRIGSKVPDHQDTTAGSPLQPDQCLAIRIPSDGLKPPLLGESPRRDRTRPETVAVRIFVAHEGLPSMVPGCRFVAIWFHGYSTEYGLSVQRSGGLNRSVGQAANHNRVGITTTAAQSGRQQ